MSAGTPPIIIRHLGRTDFSDICGQMQDFTAGRTSITPDEIWMTEHEPVYSLGLNRKNVRLPLRDDIPVIHCDRGGKMTYHGPGQVVMYVLLDLNRYALNIRQLVSLLENTVITLLSNNHVNAEAKKDAPGVYVNEAKIASLGLRMKKHYCYHGLSLNINMDISPFKAIDPCGYAGLAVTQTVDLGIDQTFSALSNQLVTLFQSQLSIHQSC